MWFTLSYLVRLGVNSTVHPYRDGTHIQLPPSVPWGTLGCQRLPSAWTIFDCLLGVAIHRPRSCSMSCSSLRMTLAGGCMTLCSHLNMAQQVITIRHGSQPTSQQPTLAWGFCTHQVFWTGPQPCMWLKMRTPRMQWMPGCSDTTSWQSAVTGGNGSSWTPGITNSGSRPAYAGLPLWISSPS